VLLLVAAIAVLAVWTGFDQAVGPAWYRTRQRQLASDFQIPRKGLKTGQAAAVLQIPGIGANLMVVQGSGSSLLRGGPGHRLGTPLPGSRGNSVIDGHRTRWGGPFRHLAELVPRTRIDTQTRTGLPVEFRVTVVKRVDGAALAKLLAPSRDVRITLVTQAGGAFSGDRLVVQAVAGPVSTRVGRGATPAGTPTHDSGGPSALAALGCLAVAAAASRLLQRDHGRAAVLVVVVPLLVGSLLAALLTLDGLLSPLL
jgi:LPXTG-site transpeptidase (sortase) family protein